MEQLLLLFQNRWLNSMAKMGLPKKSVRWLIVLLLSVFLLSFVAGKSGLITIYKLRGECQELDKKLALEKAKADSLTLVENRLQADNTYIERVARAKLGYSRPGEVVIKFVDQE